MNAKSQTAFMRRTLKRLQERGLSARDLFLQELAQEAVDTEFSDLFMRYVDAKDAATRKDSVTAWQELLTERDFGNGMATDLWDHCVAHGFPRVSRGEKNRLALHWCLVGRATQFHEREGV